MRSLVAAMLLTIAVFSAHAQDAPAPAESAETVLANVPGLERVMPQRFGKVLILEGQVAREADKELAEKIAQANNAGGQVVNRIEIVSGTLERIVPTLRVSLQKLARLVGSIPLLLVAFGVIWAFWRAGRWVSRRGFVGRSARGNPFVGELVRQAIRVFAVLAGLLFALEILDATTFAAALLGSAGVVGIALGFAFRDLLENYIAGILLSLRRPFAPDDSVAIDVHQGVVVGMNSRATILMTPDGNQLSLPNAFVFKAVLLNFTSNGNRRFEFSVAIEPRADLAAVMREGLQAVRETADVLAQPAPSVQIAEIARDAVRVQFFGWVDQRRGDFGRARSEAQRAVRARLEALGVDFGPPQMRLVASNDAEAMPEAASPSRGVPPPRDTEAPPPAPSGQAIAAAVEEARRELGAQDLLRERRHD
ncbi:MAG TPA: mechanosensitive ion channel family protein [Tahibacter sp.]|uniref:mechanosensitive ion channel family protein n=1 Tax=Tahibacter sp. TaxID=2056211 RepID=UPI002C7BF8E4|nr:mechanosensitive ion channel family protein [Tahibacter sp.]HSX62837.1 mechanosensitive ion channel family protein [Tahibacter sp.]